MTAPRKCQIEIVPTEDVAKAEVRFMLDENMDKTCQIMNGEPLVYMQNIKLDGEKFPDDLCIQDEEGNIRCLIIHELSKERRYRLSFEFTPPPDLPFIGDERMALKTEIIRRKPSETV